MPKFKFTFDEDSVVIEAVTVEQAQEIFDELYIYSMIDDVEEITDEE